MRVRHSISLAWLVVLASQLSCSDSSDGGGASISTGLPSTNKLSSLDEDDAEKICVSVARGFNNFLTSSEKQTIACTALAIPLSYDEKAGTGDVAKCKQLVDRCMNGEKISEEKGLDLEELKDEEECEEPGANDNILSCEATVGDLEACAGALLDEYASRFRLINCDNLADIENTKKKVQAGIDPEKIPACKTIATDCPEIELGD